MKGKTMDYPFSIVNSGSIALDVRNLYRVGDKITVQGKSYVILEVPTLTNGYYVKILPIEKKTIVYNKLVRDNTIEEIEKDGHNKAEWEFCSDSMFFETLLRNKLAEEAQEVVKAEGRNEFIKEMADVEAVFEELIKLLGINCDAISTAKYNKKNKRGLFDKRIYLKSVTYNYDAE